MTGLRIGLNATCFSDRPSGARQRFVGLYGELIRRRPNDEFVIYEPADCRVASWFSEAPNVVARVTPLPSTGRTRRPVAGLSYWRGELRATSLDLFEMFNLPLVKASCPTLLTIHDLRRLKPDQPRLSRALYRAVLCRGLARADHVITASKSVEEEIRSFRPSTKVSTIYNGIDLRSFASLADASRSGSSCPPFDFILAVGHLYKRKNHATLVDAMARLPEPPNGPHLLIVGNSGDQQQALERQIARLGLAGRVSILRDLDDITLRQLYDRCRFVVFPSTQEGFGIPILEAMAAHRPILLSDTAVFREVTENQSLYFPPLDDAALAAVIKQLWSSPELRERLACYGDRHVAQFAFADLAEDVSRLYDRLTSSGP
jgi:glycosyltransferase involved in cell wall biosynthesis